MLSRNHQLNTIISPCYMWGELFNVWMDDWWLLHYQNTGTITSPKCKTRMEPQHNSIPAFKHTCRTQLACYIRQLGSYPAMPYRCWLSAWATLTAASARPC